MSNQELTQYLKENDLLLVSKQAFYDFMVEVNLKTKVDKRVKWIDKKTVLAKYGVTDHWLRQCEKDPFSLVEVKKGPGRTSTKLYRESSIIKELEK